MSEGEQEQMIQAGWRFPASLYWQVHEVAGRRRMSANKLVRLALRHYLEEAEREGVPEQEARHERERREALFR